MKTSETGVGYNGRHDHPTTSQTQRCGRFGSTLCYPCSRCFPCSNSTGSTKRSRACLCIGSSISTARQSEITERITRSIKSVLMVLAASTRIVRALDEHVGCTDPHFIAQPTARLCISAVCRRAIAPQDNVRDNRVAGVDCPFQSCPAPRLRFIALLSARWVLRMKP